MKIDYFDSRNPLTAPQIASVSEFLCHELGAFGDPVPAIAKAIDYAQSEQLGKGGLIAVMSDADRTVGALVVNRTGMDTYIPENIIVYLAVRSDCRGCGLGQQLLSSVLGRIHGGVALHVDHTNPAASLYRRMGFVAKYIEMRLEKEV